MHSIQNPAAIDAPRSTDEALGLLGEIEAQLARLQSAQAGGADRLEQIDRRWNELLHREGQVAEAFGRLEQQERWFASQVAELERRNADLAAREASIGFERLDLDRQRRAADDLAVFRQQAEEEIAKLASQLETVRGDAETRRRELEARADSIEREKATLIREVRRLEAALAERQDRVDRREFEAAVTRSTSLEKHASELEVRLADRDRTAKATEATLSRRLAGLERSLAEAKAALSEAEARVEDSAESGEKAAQLAEQVATLERRFEEAERTATSQREEAERLRRELEKVRHDAASRRDANAAAERSLADRVAKAKALEEETAGLRSRLDRSESECASLRGELEKSRESASQQERRIATLQRQLDHRAVEDGAASRVEAELTSLRERFEKASSRVSELEESLGKANAARTTLEEDLARLRSQSAPSSGAESAEDVDRLEMLESSLEKAEAAIRERDARIEALAADLRAARETSRRTSAEESGRLQEKARQLGRIATMLKARRERLRGVRRALRDRMRERGEARADAPRRTGQAALHEVRQLQQKREELRQVQKFLADSEVRMVRRWATRSAASLAMIATLFIGGLCAAAWVASDHVWPAPGTASVDMIARGAKGQPLDPRLADAWKQWHAAILADPIFAEDVAKRLEARGVSPSDAATVAAMLQRDLRLDSDGPGRLRLVLSGEDRRLLPPVLDTVATSLASESASQAPRRPDRTPAIVIGERARDGRIAYSLLDPRPVDRERLVHAGMLAGGGLGIAIAIAVPAMLIYRRVRRLVPEEELAPLAS